MDGKFLGIVKLPIFSASFWREQMTRPKNKILTFQSIVLKLNSEELGYFFWTNDMKYNLWGNINKHVATTVL